ncbi:MAG: NFACT RNA binding domain-containing protein [Bacilli bacterium]
MRLTNGILINISNELNELYNFSFISNIYMINSTDIIITFSKNRKDVLLVSLDEKEPYIYHSNNITKVDTIINKTLEHLRKELNDSFLTKIEVINNDRVICFTFKKRDDYYNEVIRKLIIELIPTKTNLIITDEKDVVIFANKTRDISFKRPILKGIKYESESNVNNLIFEGDLKEYKSYINEKYLYCLEKRKEEKFRPFLIKIKGRIKKNNRREELLLLDYNESKNNLQYLEIGNMILTLQNDIDELKKYLSSVSYDLYDDDTNPINNANKAFLLYKKAKSKIYHDEIELEKIKEENENLNSIINNFYYLNEDDLFDINEQYHLVSVKNNNKKEKHKNKLYFIEYQNYKIFFGKSDKQNDNLTFSYAKKEDTFLHVSGYKGAHVVIKGENFSDEVLIFAASIALTLSNKNDGDVDYTLIKNVKRGNKKGLALLKERKTIHLNKINQNVKDILIKNQKSI